MCKGGSPSCTNDYITAPQKQDETFTTQSVSITGLDSDMPENDNELEVLPSPKERAAWIRTLQEMFPDVAKAKLDLYFTSRCSRRLGHTGARKAPQNCKALMMFGSRYNQKSRIVTSPWYLKEISYRWEL